MRVGFILALFAGLLAVAPAAAQDRDFTLVIKDRKFEPAELTLPAKTRIKLTIKNQDATAAEFESPDLRREKVVPARGEAILYIGPASPGSYEFFDDFHPENRGKIIIK